MRQRKQPIRLFGESDVEAYQRLTQLQVCEQEGEEGLKNDYKTALDMVYFVCIFNRFIKVIKFNNSYYFQYAI